MADIEQNKPESQTIEYMETSETKVETHMVPVAENAQARIRRKVGDQSRPSFVVFTDHTLQFDKKMLSIVCLLYVLSYLDRGNIGNAKTAGIMKDLHLSDPDWVWVLQVFYICYVLFEWTQLFWKILPAHIYVAALCFL